MVVFPPACPPTVLNAYSNIPLQANLSSTIRREFDIGAFARFRDPSVTLTIHDRPDFYHQSSLAVREILDREGHTDGFVLIDANVTKPGPSIRREEPFSTALWWVTSRADSEDYTREFTEDSHSPPITYPGEAFVLWRVRVLTQDLPIQWINWDIDNTDLTEDISQTFPYDPHDDQVDAYTLGLNFSNKAEADGFYIGPYIEANYSEVEISRDMEQRRRFLPLPSCVVRLTQAAATEAGLISGWTASYGDIPQPGDVVRLQQDYDWDSPKWAWNGTANLRFPKRLRRGRREIDGQSRSYAIVEQNPQEFSHGCQRLRVANITSSVQKTHGERPPPPVLLQSPATS